MSVEAMKQWLEALESIQWLEQDAQWARKIHKSVESLRQAIEQAQKQPDYSICPTCGGMADDPIVPPDHRKPNLEWVGLDYDDIDALGLSIAKARAVEALLKGRNT